MPCLVTTLFLQPVNNLWNQYFEKFWENYKGCGRNRLKSFMKPSYLVTYIIFRIIFKVIVGINSSEKIALAIEKVGDFTVHVAVTHPAFFLPSLVTTCSPCHVHVCSKPLNLLFPSGCRSWSQRGYWARQEERWPTTNWRNHSCLSPGLPWRSVLWEPHVSREGRLLAEVWQLLLFVAIKDSVLPCVLHQVNSINGSSVCHFEGGVSLSNVRLSMVGPPHHVVSWGFLQDILGIDVIPCLTYLYLSWWYLWYMIICTKIILWTMVLYQNLFHVIASKIIIYKHKLSSFWKSLLWELGASVSFLFLSFLEIVFHVLVDAVMVWREVMGTLYAVSSSGMTFWTCNMGQCVLIKSANSCSQVTDAHTI